MKKQKKCYIYTRVSTAIQVDGYSLGNWAFRNTDYPTLYSYCKYTNVPSIKTAESIGTHFECEYPDETNGTTHVSAISREEWLNEMTEIT